MEENDMVRRHMLLSRITNPMGQRKRENIASQKEPFPIVRML